MNVEKKVPEIRFKGFSGEWHQSNLAECTDLLTGNPFNSKEFTSSGFLLVRGMNVKRGYLDTSTNISEYWSSAKGLERYLLEPEDIVIQMDGALIGKSYAKINSKNLPAILVQRVTRVRCDKIEPEIIYQYIQKDFLNHIAGIKTETAVPHLSLHDIRSFSVFLPERKEQTQIGNYFQKLDSLINRHQQKHDQLSNIKKAMLEKMFPKPGETIPEIRFKEFSGEWEERCLSDVCWFQEGPGVRSHQFTAFGVKLFNGTNIEKGKIDLDKTTRYISEEEAYGYYSHFLADAGDVVIACSGVTVAKFEEKVAVLDKEHLPLCMNTSTMRFKVKSPTMHRDYLVQILASSLFKKQIGGSATGSAQLNFGPSHVSKVLIPLPSFEEQTAIGNYFQKLDALINQHQQQITKLTNIKQAFLRKMFV